MPPGSFAGVGNTAEWLACSGSGGACGVRGGGARGEWQQLVGGLGETGDAGPLFFLSSSAPRGAGALQRRRGFVSFFECLCAPAGRCTPPQSDGTLQCPMGSHVDPDACRPHRVLQTIVTTGCRRPPPPSEPPNKTEDDAAVDKSNCQDQDKPINNFLLHKEDGDKGSAVTCKELRDMDACNDPERPSLSAKVQAECPCTCGVSKMLKPAIPSNPVDLEYTEQLRRENPCHRDYWDIGKIELYEYHHHIKVHKLDTDLNAGCGVNKSPWRPWWLCRRLTSLLMGPFAPGPTVDENGCTNNPAYDAGVRIGSELIEVDGKDDFRKWGKDALKHLDLNQCHKLVFVGPDPPPFGPSAFHFFKCKMMPQNMRDFGWSSDGWAPDGCKGTGNTCPGGQLCCVEHKTLEHPEDQYIVRCPKNSMCKGMGSCEYAEGRPNVCQNRVTAA
eukprot:TRINITY_DN74323_c0_g1_i1.p1 TRINITY_DN74323_c0_g1~~TRINITY_DN74323_c0_g1_i1.p1  ORF type:complete len:443 (+),score=69.65 TRINITY_DN74323_c0_g1_i1:13-1341(+)